MGAGEHPAYSAAYFAAKEKNTLSLSQERKPVLRWLRKEAAATSAGRRPSEGLRAGFPHPREATQHPAFRGWDSPLRWVFFRRSSQDGVLKAYFHFFQLLDFLLKTRST